MTSMIYGQEDEKLKAKSAVDTFFAGFHKDNITLMKTVHHE
ncbi:hypothetical protein [Aestuariibaculum suncheonense]|nr:hypothetical protein [Aestuariibaculum suncheonense]